MTFEQSFTVNLGSATAFEVQGDELEIRFAGGAMTLIRVPDADPPDAGPPDVDSPEADSE
jgi:hypothetical protein